MKTLQLFICSILIAFILPKCASGQKEQSGKEDEKTYYYGVEINDVLCGYVKLKSIPEEKEGKKMLNQGGIVNVKVSVLGGGVDLLINYSYLVDPETEQFSYNETTVQTGEAVQEFKSEAVGDSIMFESVSGNEKKSFLLTPDIIMEGPLTTKFIVDDFIKGGASERHYRVYDPGRGKIFDKTYTRVGEEELELAGKKLTCLVLEEINPALGVKAKQWYDIASGMNVQTLISTRRIFLADPSVVKKITTVKLDDILFAKVDTKIPDIHNITYMKVRGKIESTGEQITAESLNHVGQTFTGTVTDNLIEGIFELTPVKYDGAGAPSFPPDFSDDPDLEKYMKSENLIESDAPVLVEEAMKITEGSADAWEAAKRLSKWVAEEIEGAVPGGTSAINTYNIRQGECGSHSRLLTAFCRAVGIPARLAVGCMYSTIYGGSFGQHAWTEVYMGDAGWIPVDATAFEIDFIDAGHIRLGEMTSFNPKEMEILEYRMAEGSVQPGIDSIPADFRPYLGKYTDLSRNRTFTVVYQDNSLGVDIPGQIVFVLNEPDEQGRWYPKLTRQLCFELPKTTVGLVEKMIVTQTVSIPRKSDPDTMPEEVPVELHPLIGSYDLPQAQLVVNLNYKDGYLTIPDLLGRTKEPVILKNTENGWLSEDGRYLVNFDIAEDGTVSRMVTAISFTFSRGEPAANVIRKVIEEEGIEAGLKRYDELKAENRGEYIFKEGLMNTLGYRLLGEDKIAEAIEIFKVNAKEHPDSFNVYDSLGEAYMKHGDNELAIKSYQKSIELNPENENGKKMLEKIQSGE